MNQFAKVIVIGILFTAGMTGGGMYLAAHEKPTIVTVASPSAVTPLPVTTPSTSFKGFTPKKTTTAPVAVPPVAVSTGPSAAQLQQTFLLEQSMLADQQLANQITNSEAHPVLPAYQPIYPQLVPYVVPTPEKTHALQCSTTVNQQPNVTTCYEAP